MHNHNDGDVILGEIVEVINRLYKKTKLTMFLSKPSSGLYNTIYHMVVNYGVSKEDRKVSLKDLFKNLINKKRKNVFALIEPFYCRFVSSDFKANSKTSHIKIYLPFNYKYIETLPNSALFDILNGFIEGNNRNINLYYNRARGFKDIDYFLSLIMYFSYKKTC